MTHTCPFPPPAAGVEFNTIGAVGDVAGALVTGAATSGVGLLFDLKSLPIAASGLLGEAVGDVAGVAGTGVVAVAAVFRALCGLGVATGEATGEGLAATGATGDGEATALVLRCFGEGEGAAAAPVAATGRGEAIALA